MTDKRNWIERAQSWAEKTRGSAYGVDEMAAEFALYGSARRAQSLEEIDTELASDEPLTLNDGAKMLDTLERREVLGVVHDELRKSGR